MKTYENFQIKKIQINEGIYLLIVCLYNCVCVFSMQTRRWKFQKQRRMKFAFEISTYLSTQSTEGPREMRPRKQIASIRNHQKKKKKLSFFFKKYSNLFQQTKMLPKSYHYSEEVREERNLNKNFSFLWEFLSSSNSMQYTYSTYMHTYMHIYIIWGSH